ncbi:MAG: polysaccharide deacetylase family protein [Gaiellales bacterium]|nr:polysaccharide deacetylase family protein [Gaiellales bacterium]
MALLVLVAGIVALVGALVARGDPSRSAGVVAAGTVATSSGGADPSVGTGGHRGPVTVTTEPVEPAGDAPELPATLPAAGAAVHAPILMYHYVDDEPPTEMGPYAASLTVATGEFRAQAAYLAEHGVETIDFAELYRAMAGISALPTPRVLLTFDDGGADLYTHAFPILKQYGLTATFFIITSEIGKPGYLTWAQLAEMREAGMSVQSHSATHPDLPSCTDERLQTELRESKRAIEQSLGEATFVLCYPAGSYDQRVQEAARDAGYLLAVTTDPGKESSPATPMVLPRVRVQPGLSVGQFAGLIE